MEVHWGIEDWAAGHSRRLKDRIWQKSFVCLEEELSAFVHEHVSPD